MMGRSARRRETSLGEYVVGGLLVSGAAISRNPVLVGGSTAFLVTLFYVSANAIWYQPGMHAGAVFATRPPVEAIVPAPRPRPVRGALSAPTGADASRLQPAADPQMEAVQAALAAKGFDPGTVDGLEGPQTRQAILDWQRTVGAEETGQLTERQISQLLARPIEASAPVPPSRATAEGEDPHTASVAEADPTLMRVQAGLRAFGNEGIEIDGLIGPETAAAIREFQTLFGLSVTGAVNEELLAKMRDVGLTD